jgi:hypothetical protein
LWQKEAQKVLKINTPTVESQWNLYSKVSKYGNDKRDYLRGFGYQGGASRGLWHKEVAELALEAILKIPCHYLQITGAWD